MRIFSTYILQFVFLVVIVKPSAHHQVTKSLQIKNTFNYDRLHNVMKIHMYTLLVTVLKKNYFMDHNLFECG